MIVDIREIEKVRLKNAIMIEGFPGIGMIGTISASYLADKLGMRIVGYISSSHFPPIAAIHDFVPVSPARIYASEKHNLVILFSEFVIPSEVAYALSQRILKYAKEKGVKEIYSLAGIASDKPTDKIYGIGSSKEMVDRLKKAGVEVIKEALARAESLCNNCLNIRYLGSGTYRLTVTAPDYKGAEKMLARSSDAASEIIIKADGTSELIRKE